MDDALGPGYNYWENIKSPSEMGMSGEGSIKALSNDINGLISYVSVLVDGTTDASKTGEPLGNRFLLPTMAKCRNVMSDRSKPDSEGNPIYVPRYIYVDNVPDGTIPFISSGPDGGKMDDFKGLIPGAIGNLSAFSPSGFYRAFTMGNYPDCIKVALRTKNNENEDGVQTEYVAVADILNEISSDNMPEGNPVNGVADACRFKDYLHPVTQEQKTKEVCEPDKTEDGFSMLLPSALTTPGYSTSGSTSGSNSSRARARANPYSQSDSESDSESNAIRGTTKVEELERLALKQMRKMRRHEKQLHDITKNNFLGRDRSHNNKVVQHASDADFDSKYETMRLDRSTLLDDNRRARAGEFDEDIDRTPFRLSDDVVSRMYYGIISGIGLYILYRILYTKRTR